MGHPWESLLSLSDRIRIADLFSKVIRTVCGDEPPETHYPSLILSTADDGPLPMMSEFFATANWIYV